MRKRVFGDGGLTLVEMSVSVLLAGVLGAVLSTAIVGSFHRQSEIDARATSITTARQALERTMREVRGADPLLALSDNQLAMQETNAAGVVRTLNYSVVTSGGDASLVLDETDVDALGVTLPPPPRKVIAAHLVSGTPIFSVVTTVATWTPTSTVDAACHVIGTSNPDVYAPDCIGTLKVHFVIDPKRRSGTSVCSGSGSDCFLDVYDFADMRNNQS